MHICSFLAATAASLALILGSAGRSEATYYNTVSVGYGQGYGYSVAVPFAVPVAYPAQTVVAAPYCPVAVAADPCVSTQVQAKVSVAPVVTAPVVAVQAYPYTAAFVGSGYSNSVRVANGYGVSTNFVRVGVNTHAPVVAVKAVAVKNAAVVERRVEIQRRGLFGRRQVNVSVTRIR